MKRLTNQTGIPLSLAVWLSRDTYTEHAEDVISATALTNPIRAIVLSRQNKDLDSVGDIVSLVAAQSGTAYHDAIRQAWLDPKLNETLEILNYPKNVIDRIVVNPDKKLILDSDAIVVWVEVRTEKKVGDYVISGELDFCAQGNLEDHKSTSVYAWIFDSNATNYILQGSIYRWLNPEKVTGDSVNINYIFTDWSASKARQDKSYPQKRIMSKAYPLMSIGETDTWIKDKLNSVQSLMGSSQSNLPLCTKDELWQSDSVWKYYKDPTKKTRSTKNFDNPSDAQLRLQHDGNVGEVIEVVGQVKKCAYCKVNEICDQAKDLVSAGLLIL